MRKYLIIAVFVTLTSVLNSIADINIQTWYKLGEGGVGAGNLPIDSSGNNRNFIIDAGNGVVGVTVSSTSPAPGSSQYYAFSGDLTGFSEIGWDPPENNVGVECWARSFDLEFITGTTVGRVVFGTGHNQNGLGILYDDFGAGFIGVIGNINYVGLPYIPATTNEWVHVAVVRDNGVTTFYVNGVARTPTRTDTPNDSTIPYMGYGGSLINFPGAIDDARIFTFAPGEFYPKDLMFYQSTNTMPYVTGFKGAPTGFTVKVKDKATTINTSSILVSFDGSPVTTNLTQAAGLTTIVYTSPSYLAAGSTHNVTLIFADSAAVWQTNNLSFVVGSYLAVPAAYAMAPGSVNTTQPGFKLAPYQTDGSTANGQQPNSLAWTEDQLLGLHGPNIADLSFADATGSYTNTEVINYSIEAGGTDRGNFGSDQPFPGIPGTLFTTGNSTVEVLTFLQFTNAGIYTMGVNSDDGFKVSTYYNPRDVFSLVLGQFDGGRGASDTLFTFLIPQAGIYPFRLLWENGNGELTGNQANLEWFSVLDNGTKVLINDNASPIRAYYIGGPLPPYVSKVVPGINQRGVLPASKVEVDLTDAGTTVAGTSIRIGLNGGTPVVPTSFTKVGLVTTATLTPSTPFTPSSTNTALVSWADNVGRNATNSWQFVALSASLPPGLRTVLGSGIASQPGFRVRTYQVNYAIQNELPIADQMIHGVAYSDNFSDLSTAVNGVFTVPGMINWNRDAGTADIGFFQTPDYPDAGFPGIPGTTASYENFAVEALTYVEFPTAGVYTLGVNSDDGFRVTVGDSTGPDFGGVRIAAPSNLVSNYASWPTYWANGGQFGGPLPKPEPVVRYLVKADDGTTPQDIYTLNGSDNTASYTFLRAAPTNSSQLAGNIAVVRRGGGITFAQKARYCQDAGAVAVLVVNRPDLVGTLPFGMGGSDPGVTIPCVFIDWGQYTNFWPSISTTTNSGVVASISEDCSPLLAEFDGGRGAGTPTLFSFAVPQAGVYPLRLLFWQGQGGANCELFSVDSAGNYVLLNDTSNPTALKAYRARNVASRGAMNPPVVSGNNVTLSWTQTGELEQADSLTGPWVKAPNQNNPQTRSASGAQKYFRLRVY